MHGRVIMKLVGLSSKNRILFLTYKLEEQITPIIIRELMFQKVIKISKILLYSV